MATPTPSTPAPGPVKVKSPRPRKLVIVIAVLLSLSTAGAIAGYYLRDQFKPAPAPVSEPVYVALAPITVNLKPGDPHQFVHVGVTLKVADAKTQALVNQYLPEVSSRLLLVLSNRESGLLVSAADKAALANEALAALNQPFGPGLQSLKISSVLFPVFMLQ